MAGNLLEVLGETVVESKFLAGLGGAAAEEINVTPMATGVEVRVAAVIDEFRAAAANGGVHLPVLAKAKEIDGLRAPRCPELPETLKGNFVRDALTGVFDDFFVAGNGFGGENAETVNPRTPDEEPETGSTRTDLASDGERSSFTSHGVDETKRRLAWTARRLE